MLDSLSQGTHTHSSNTLEILISPLCMSLDWRTQRKPPMHRKNMAAPHTQGGGWNQSLNPLSQFILNLCSISLWLCRVSTEKASITYSNYCINISPIFVLPEDSFTPPDQSDLNIQQKLISRHANNNYRSSVPNRA